MRADDPPAMQVVDVNGIRRTIIPIPEIGRRVAQGFLDIGAVEVSDGATRKPCSFLYETRPKTATTGR